MKAAEPPNPFESVPRTIAALARLAELALDEVDITLAQYRLLGFCTAAPTTPTEVAVWLSVKKQSVTTQLDALVRRGYLERTSDDHDRRRTIHTLTPAGRRKLAEAERAIEVYYEVVVGTIGAAERRSAERGLANLGRALNRAWDRARAATPPRPITGWLATHQGRSGGA